MNPENTAKLIAAYPLLYRDLREWGFECDDGWFDLVWKVSAEIEAAAALKGISKISQAWPAVGVLKQKFGTLRVQFDGQVDAEISAVAVEAAAQSLEVCEFCGAPAQRVTQGRLSGWVKTLCTNCRRSR